MRTAHSQTKIARPAHLIHNVLKNQIIPIMHWYYQGIPSIVAFVDTHKTEINGLFLYVISSNFSDENEENNIKFKEVYNIWLSFWK